MPETYLVTGLLAGIFAAGFLAGYGLRSLKSRMRRRSILARVQVYHQAEREALETPCTGEPKTETEAPPARPARARVVAGLDRLRRKA